MVSKVVYSQPSMVQYTRHVHKVVIQYGLSGYI